MKFIVMYYLMVVSALCASAQDLALCRAREHGALAMECLRVVDPAGHPVAGAKVWGGLQTGGNLGDFTPHQWHLGHEWRICHTRQMHE